MQGSPSDIVSSIEVGVELQDLVQLISTARRSDMHQQIDTAVHDRIIDREAVLNDTEAWLHIPLVNSLDDDCFCASKRSGRRWLLLSHTRKYISSIYNLLIYY